MELVEQYRDDDVEQDHRDEHVIGREEGSDLRVHLPCSVAMMIVLFIVLSRNKLNFSFAAVGCRGQGAVSEVGLEVLWFRVWV